MTYTWEDTDIVCGRIVCKPITGPVDGWHAKWTFKIGFNPSEDSSEAQYVLIAMTDGMVGFASTKKEMATHLNETEMIPMPHSRLLQTMEYLRDGYESDCKGALRKFKESKARLGGAPE